jgi:hypothetical protein
MRIVVNRSCFLETSTLERHKILGEIVNPQLHLITIKLPFATSASRKRM